MQIIVVRVEKNLDLKMGFVCKKYLKNQIFSYKLDFLDLNLTFIIF